MMSMFLIGCDVDNNNHGYGFEYDFITPLGIEYKNKSNSIGLSSIELEQELKNVFSCISSVWYDKLKINEHGLSFYPDLMVITADKIINSDREGRYYSSPNLILLVSEKSPNYKTDSKIVYRHELVHYILEKMTGSNHSNHQSIFFNSCVYF